MNWDLKKNVERFPKYSETNCKATFLKVSNFVSATKA